MATRVLALWVARYLTRLCPLLPVACRWPRLLLGFKTRLLSRRDGGNALLSTCKSLVSPLQKA